MDKLLKALDSKKALQTSVSLVSKKTIKAPERSDKNIFDQILKAGRNLTICQLVVNVERSIKSVYRPNTEEIEVGTSLVLYIRNGPNAEASLNFPKGIYKKEIFCEMFKTKNSGEVLKRSRGNTGGVRGGGEGTTLSKESKPEPIPKQENLGV